MTVNHNFKHYKVGKSEIILTEKEPHARTSYHYI